jgi:hypothetical protein
LRSIAVLGCVTGCARPTADIEAPMTMSAPSWAADDDRFAAELAEMQDAPCEQLVEMFPSPTPRGAHALAERLVLACEVPATIERQPQDELRHVEQAADLVFRKLPPQLGPLPLRDDVYAFLGDPTMLARTRRLFAHFVAHHHTRDERDGAQRLAEWAPHDPLYRRLGLTCDELAVLQPDTGAALQLWQALSTAASCATDQATGAYAAALRGTSSGRAVACAALAAAPRGLESAMVVAARDDPGEHERECRGPGGLRGIFNSNCTIVSSRHPGRDACMRTLAAVHGVAVLRATVDSPAVTLQVAYVGQPRTIIVFTAGADGVATPGYVGSSDPAGVPAELAPVVAGAWGKSRKLTRLAVQPVGAGTAALDDRGAFTDAAGPHEWSIALPRYPLPPKIVVLVLDRDGTVRRATNP